MVITITEAQALILKEMNPVSTVEELQALLANVKERQDSVVTEVMEPDQAFETTRTELKDLYLIMTEEKIGLATVGYTDTERGIYRDAGRALFTVDALFNKQIRFGDWRPRPVQDVVKASVPWRDKLRRKATQAFFFDEAKLATYQDHNETGTIEEEVSDLRALVDAVGRDAAALKPVGITPEDILEGERLLGEADGRDNLAIIGIRNQADVKQTRDRLLTLSVLLARHARAVGMSAFWDNPVKAARFERINFRNAMRRLRPMRASAAETPATPVKPVVEPVDG